MRRVTTGASGGYRQAALQQAFAVDAFSVVGDDLMLLAFVGHSRLLTFTMAARTKLRHVGREGGGFGVAFAENPVRSVADGASRRVGISLGELLTMHAALVLLA